MNAQTSIRTPVRWLISTIGAMSATTVRGAVRANREPLLRDDAREAFDVLGDLRARARQPEVRGVDAEAVHPPENVDLLVDRRHADRRRLQSIPQRLVVQHRRRLTVTRAKAVAVPVVNQWVRDDAQFGSLSRM